MSPIQYRTHYYQKLIKNLSKLLGADYFQHLFYVVFKNYFTTIF